MARIAGVDLPREKRVEIGLTYIYGIGRASADRILEAANVDPSTRVRDLTDDEVKRISAVIDESQTVEGDVTASYIASMAKKYGITVSRIATGVPLGGDLGSVDGNTLAMSFNYRRNM